MRKIPTLYVRDVKDGKIQPRVTKIIAEGCEWVAEGLGIPTRKRDGTAILVQGGNIFKRYTLKPGAEMPEGFQACGEPDPETNKIPGWVPTDLKAPEDCYLREAVEREILRTQPLTESYLPDNYIKLQDGTYEACGPKIGGGHGAGSNPEGLAEHRLFKHGGEKLVDVPRDFDGIKAWLKVFRMEGIVFHHADGVTMAKIKSADFGIAWGASGQ